MSIRRKGVIYWVGICIAVAVVWAGYSSLHRPLLVHTPGDWTCACGEMYIKTTIWGIWNPFRDREPEVLADKLLSKLRANDCGSNVEVCQASMPTRRVSAWMLSYREDTGNMATLYYKLTKYGAKANAELTGVGAVDVRKTVAGWQVAGFDCYF